MNRHIPILSYFNYLSLGRQIRFAGTILQAPAEMLCVGSENTVFQHVKNLYKLYTPHFYKNVMLEVKYKGFFTLCNIDYKGNFVAMLPEDGEEFLIDDVRMRLMIKNHGYSVYVPNVYHERISIRGYKYGLISDIDDTILHTGATTLFPRIKRIIFTRSYQRKCIESMPEVFRLLTQYGAKTFYVSNSEANLFPVIETFLRNHKFPQGSCFLRKNKLLSHFLKRKKKTVRSKTSHKLRTISLILRTQKDKKFILVGDNGQWDPLIYRTIIRNFPGRILYVFLRDIHDKISLHRKCWNGVPVIYFSSINDIKSFIAPRLDSNF
ncbi:MAG: DUF2183 domain-containing protein [Flavobacteriales bacterium]|nr:DUF2183 domain-containing protein [Flavobacteriales bacterium]